MSVAALVQAGRRAAERLMTDTWIVYRVEGQTFDPNTGDYVDTVTTVYDGKGKLQTFESYEQTPAAGEHTYVIMRKSLHLPIGDASDEIQPNDYAVCQSSALDSGLVGVTVRVAGVADKTFTTARRFPVAEVEA